MPSPRILLATAASLVAFAANSLLARAALSGPGIDPAGFTALRLGSGAVTLFLVARLCSEKSVKPAGSWLSAVALFVYACAFSWAYLTLSAGTGALILFGTVQITMIGWGWVVGERPGVGQWVGFALAFSGLGYLLVPGLQAPDSLGALLMAASGVAWGIYSLRGRGSQQPALATAGNFLRAVPLAIAALALAWPVSAPSAEGAFLAVVSGAITSGLGYVIWYRALGGLSATLAGVVQLAVPALAAIGGVALLGEPMTLRLAISGIAILAGVALASLASR